MEIIFIKQLSDSGETSSAAIDMERELRAKGFWGALTAVVDRADAGDISGPTLLVQDAISKQLYTDVASFQQRFDLATNELSYPQAACW
ncbi:MAG: hypothetical protein ACU84Q_11675 [Gammaproteobacteria bacterium]